MLSPTKGCVFGIGTPVKFETVFESSVNFVVSIPNSLLYKIFNAMTNCARGTFPALSPHPLIVVQIWVAPEESAVRAFVRPKPKSL